MNIKLLQYAGVFLAIVGIIYLIFTAGRRYERNEILAQPIKRDTTFLAPIIRSLPPESLSAESKPVTARGH